jgi:hypothetical protein
MATLLSSLGFTVLIIVGWSLFAGWFTARHLELDL